MQRAFLDEQAAQCGYCIPGMMMRAQALLQKRPQATDAEIRAALQGNLCRCGTHMRILRAVRRAAEAMKSGKGRRSADAPGRGAMIVAEPRLTRRALLAGTGALVIGFALPSPRFAQAGGTPDPLPGSLKKSSWLDGWIRVDASNAVTVFTGKAELGQGIKTALVQVAAEELDLPVDVLSIRTADTGTTPDEGYTAGSHSMQDSGSAIRAAAAEVRQILLAEASRRLGEPSERLRTEGGTVVAPDGRRFTYGALVTTDLIHVAATPDVRLKDSRDYRVVNRPVPRLDIPAKVTGGMAYVQDLRLPGLVHARVVRPPAYGATLTGLDEAPRRAPARA